MEEEECNLQGVKITEIDRQILGAMAEYYMHLQLDNFANSVLRLLASTDPNFDFHSLSTQTKMLMGINTIHSLLHLPSSDSVRAPLSLLRFLKKSVRHVQKLSQLVRDTGDAEKLADALPLDAVRSFVEEHYPKLKPIVQELKKQQKDVKQELEEFQEDPENPIMTDEQVKSLEGYAREISSWLDKIRPKIPVIVQKWSAVTENKLNDSEPTQTSQPQPEEPQQQAEEPQQPQPEEPQQQQQGEELQQDKTPQNEDDAAVNGGGFIPEEEDELVVELSAASEDENQQADGSKPGNEQPAQKRDSMSSDVPQLDLTEEEEDKDKSEEEEKEKPEKKTKRPRKKRVRRAPESPELTSSSSSEDEEWEEKKKKPKRKKQKVREMTESEDTGSDTSIEEFFKAKQSAASAAIKPRKKIPWTSEEITNLKRGVKKYGEGRWAKILSKYKFQDARTSTSLRDKWRNLTA